MPKATLNDAVFFDSRTEGAFEKMLDETLIFVNTFKKNNAILKKNKALELHLKEIANEEEMLKQQINQGKPIMPESLKKLSNDLNKVSEILYTYRLTPDKNKIMDDFIGEIPRTKRMDAYSNEKRIEEIQKHVMSIAENIHDSARMVKINAQLKDAPCLEKLTQASELFSKRCRDKLVSLLR